MIEKNFSTQHQQLNYHHLLYFMTIASEGTVAKAAAKLRLSQSTLSTQLGQLEGQLGIKLFERRLQRLHLTEAGGIALRYAREIAKLGDEMVDALSDRRHPHRLSVQIGALDSIPKAMVVDVVTAAQEREPCSISVIEGRQDELLRGLRAHEIDLALLNHQPALGDRSGLTSRLAGRTDVVILGAARFSRLRKGFPESLDGQPFVMPGAESRLRFDLEQSFKARSIRADVVLEAQDTSLLTLLAASGAGLIPVNATIADEMRKKHKLKSLGTIPDVHDELWLVTSERRVENPVASYLAGNYSTKR